MKLFRIIALSFFSLAFLWSCKNPTVRISESEVIQTVDSLMKLQELAWNSADIEGFMKPYLKSDSLKFIGSSGLNRGWNKTLNNYKRSYPDAAAMGELKFSNLNHDLLADSVLQVIGAWTLFRESDTLSGHYTLIWQQIGGKWQITSDHSS